MKKLTKRTWILGLCLLPFSGITQTIFSEPFDESAGSMTGNDNTGGVSWTMVCSSCLAGDHLEVVAGAMEGQDTNGPATWTTGSIDISSCPFFEISFSITSVDVLEACGTGCNSVDWVQLEYNIDGSGWQTPSNSYFCSGLCAGINVVWSDDVPGGTMLYNTGCIDGGNTLQLRITVQTWASAEKWIIDDVTVSCATGPSVGAGADATICAGTSVTLTASNPDGATITWNNGVTDGVSFTPPNGTTTYTATATLGACTATDDVQITANPLTFGLTFNNPTTCNSPFDGQITITGLTPSTNYSVSYSNGTPQGPFNLVSNGSGNIVLTGLAPGSYTDFSVSLSGCTGTDASVINLSVPGSPSVNAGPDQTICEGDPVTLTATNPDGAVISWNNGVTDGVAFFPGAGSLNYTVTATDAGNGCSSTDVVNVTVNALPVVTVNPAGPYTTSTGPQVLSASPGSGTWSADCGTCINASTGVFNPATAGAGTWTICYTAGTAPCTAQDCIQITVNGGSCPLDGTIIAGNPTCFGFADGSVTINLTGANGTPVIVITNSLGGIVNPGGSNTANNLSEGWYYFDVTDEFGCSFVDSVLLDDPGQMDIDLVIQNPACYPLPTGLAFADTVYNYTGNYSQIGYFWAPNTTGSNGIGEDSLTQLTEGSYNLTINDENGCSESFDFIISFPDSLYFVQLGYDPAYCRIFPYQSGNGVVFAAASGGTPDYTYLWENIQTGVTSNNTTWGGLNPGNYQITVTDDNNCTLSETVLVDSLNPSAEFDLTSPQFTIPYEGTAVIDAHFVNQSQYFANPNNPLADTTFFWYFAVPGENWILSENWYETFDRSYSLSGDYEVCLVALNKNGCSDTTCKIITVYDPLLFSPVNIFTPDGDGINDVFSFFDKSLSVAKFECIVVDRWGVKLYEFSSITDSWDGNNKSGNPCTDGVYFYTYSLTAFNGETREGQGTVHLIRGE